MTCYFYKFLDAWFLALHKQFLEWDHHFPHNLARASIINSLKYSKNNIHVYLTHIKSVLLFQLYIFFFFMHKSLLQVSQLAFSNSDKLKECNKCKLIHTDKWELVEIQCTQFHFPFRKLKVTGDWTELTCLWPIENFYWLRLGSCCQFFDQF